MARAVFYYDLGSPYAYLSAERMYEEGCASAANIDEVMNGCGHPMGPLTLPDFIGLDVLDSVCDSLYEEFKHRVRAAAVDQADGRIGRKAGGGFYEHGEVRQPARP